MLTITHDAATVLATTRAEMGAPDDYGVRLSVPSSVSGDRTELMLAFVPGPDPGDDITEQQGIRAYVAPDASARLSDATLDATPVDGEPSRLVLRRSQAGGEASAPAG